MSQKTDILRHLKRKSITPLDALRDYGCFRLAAVIHLLRDEGHMINTKMVDNGRKKFARYSLCI